jgi:DNA-binding NarL/FixJ family response regulator
VREGNVARKITILIADDHPIVRSGLRAVLEKEPDLAVIQEADNGDSALQLVRQMTPDIAIVDIEMPVMDGFAVAMAIQEEAIPVNVIFMTMHKDEQTFNKAMEIGVNGFVLKENAVADIVSAVESVIEGKHYISPSLSDFLMQRARVHNPSHSSVDGLTPAEKNILRLIGDQKTTRTIAEELFISPKTVEKHRSNICAKLNLHGAYALLKFAMENKGRL